MTQAIQRIPLLLAALTLSLPAHAVVGLIATGGYNFGTGDDHELRAGLNNTSASDWTVDVYVGYRLPTGQVIFGGQTGGGGIEAVPAKLNDPSTWTPLLEDFTVPAGFNTGLVPLLTYPFSGAEPGGDYIAAIGVTEAGTMNFLSVDTAEFRYIPVNMSVQGMFGQWEGSWNNNTFSSTGSAKLTLFESGPGEAFAEMDLGGQVFGAFDPPKVTLPLSLNVGRPDTFGGSTAQLGLIDGRGLANGDFESWWTSIPGVPYHTLSLTGHMGMEEMDGDYYLYADQEDDIDNPDDAEVLGTFSLELKVKF